MANWTWAQTYARRRRLASALQNLGVTRGDTVSTMLPNVAAMHEARFGIPMIGAVLDAMNIRLDAEAIAFMLEHSETKVVLSDPEFADLIAQALSMLSGPKPVVITVLPSGTHPGTDYEQLLAAGDPEFCWQLPDDEWNAIALGHTLCIGAGGTESGADTHQWNGFHTFSREGLPSRKTSSTRPVASPHGGKQTPCQRRREDAELFLPCVGADSGRRNAAHGGRAPRGAVRWGGDVTGHVCHN